jgi:hypothetical protein
MVNHGNNNFSSIFLCLKCKLNFIHCADNINIEQSIRFRLSKAFLVNINTESFVARFTSHEAFS